MPMKTDHRIIFSSSENMSALPSGSVDLVITSPPYPMIAMWDEMFCGQDGNIKKALQQGKAVSAFELMHRVLDRVWDEVERILKKGGFACINIGDAARTIRENFMLYPNHSRILQYMMGKGFTTLPVILWRKQTNAPNKFMGSGMLPAGAYVTLEHEYILILRKGRKREFQREREKQDRRMSAIFWEERNSWFSDVWMDLKGTVQKIPDGKSIRKRSGAFPFELPYRLVNMFSVKGDLVVDPFYGIGTTMLAAMAAGRNSTGFEIEKGFQKSIISRTVDAVDFLNQRINKRLDDHIEFVEKRFKDKGAFKHKNNNYGFPVITSQEKELLINQLITVRKKEKNRFEAAYSDKPQNEFCMDIPGYFSPKAEKKSVLSKRLKKSKKPVQLELPHK